MKTFTVEPSRGAFLFNCAGTMPAGWLPQLPTRPSEETAMGVLAPQSIQKHAPGAGTGALSSAPGFFGDLVQCSAHGVGWKSTTQDACRCAVETSMHRSCLQSLRSSVRYLAKLLARFPSPWERPWLAIASSPILSLLCSLFCLFPCGLETHDSLTDYVAGSWKSLRPTRILLSSLTS